MSSPNSYLGSMDGRMFSVDLADPETVLGECCLIPSEGSEATGTTDFYTIAGTTVGDAYYAYVEASSADDPVYYFYSFNMEDDETARIGEVGSEVDGTMDMAYDAATGTVYAVRQDGGNTNIYTVDVATGAQTLYGTLDGISVSGLTFDGEGNAYAVCDVTNDGGLQNVDIDLSLYSLSLNGEESTGTKIADLASFTHQTSALQSHTMAYNEGRLYFAYTSGNIMSFLTDGTGKEETRLSVRSRVAGLTFTKSTVTMGGQGQGGGDDEKDNNLRLTAVEYYGDAMGQFADDVMSKRTVTFYDQYNNPVRDVQYGRMVETYGDMDPWQMLYYTKYDYDSDHRLVSKHSEIIQEYVRGEYYYKSNNDTVNYAYDENGRLAKQTTVASGATVDYAYDDEGRLVSEVTTTPDRLGTNKGKPRITTVTYSDFTDFGEPRLITTASSYSTTWQVVEFDEDNHKVKATTYSDEARTEATTVEHWVWRNDSIVEYITNNVYDGEEEASKRRIYECVDGNPMRVREVAYYYSGGKWRMEGLPQVSCYSLLTPQYAPTNISVEPVEGQLNTSKISFDAPSFAVQDGTVSFDIYRMGQRVGTIKMTDEGAFDPASGRVTYTDLNVPNGDYDYMVQTVVKNDLTGDSTAYNVSDILPVSYYVELPAVTNVHGELLTSSLTDGNVVTVAWDAPKDLDPALLFEYYNVFVEGVGQANTDENGYQKPLTEPTCGVTFARTTQNIYVQSVYYFGRVYSDTVAINMLELPTVGIEAVTQDVDGGRVTVSAGEISVDGVASSLLVFSMGGAVEVSATNTSRVDISGLQPGVYVALVNIGGNKTAVKFTK